MKTPGGPAIAKLAHRSLLKRQISSPSMMSFTRPEPSPRPESSAQPDVSGGSASHAPRPIDILALKSEYLGDPCYNCSRMTRIDSWQMRHRDGQLLPKPPSRASLTRLGWDVHLLWLPSFEECSTPLAYSGRALRGRLWMERH